MTIPGPPESTRSAHKAVSSSFVLTINADVKVYGSAISFYEEYQDTKLTEEQRAKLNMVKYKRVSDRKIFANKCICVLSQVGPSTQFSMAFCIVDLLGGKKAQWLSALTQRRSRALNFVPYATSGTTEICTFFKYKFVESSP